MTEDIERLKVFAKAVKSVKKQNRGFFSFETVKAELGRMGFEGRWKDETIKASLIRCQRVNYVILEALKRSIARNRYDVDHYILTGQFVSPSNQLTT